MSLPPLRVTGGIVIPRSELRFRFVRSSGPGGQNVNKVSSKVQLRWSVAQSAALSPDVRQRLLSRLARRINERGELLVFSQRYRDQSRNLDDCLAKLREIVLTAATPPRRRKRTAVPRAAREGRLRDKRAQSEKKQRRRPPPTAE